MYKPTNSHTLAEAKTEQQVRLGLQGYPGTSKTWSALTFPNPVVLNIDRGLKAHQGRNDVIEVPLWDSAVCSKFLSGYNPSKLKDLLVSWLDKEGVQLEASQTLVVDGLTGLQNAYHLWFRVNQNNFLTTSGKVDAFAEWQVKKQYFGELMETFKRLRCHVVLIAHEIDLKDKNGPAGPSYSGKIRPLLTGAFGDEIVSQFTDWFRSHSADAPKDYKSLKPEEIKQNWNMTMPEFEAWCKSFTGGTIYYWQTMSDSVFDGKTSSLVGAPRYIPATFSAFQKYVRK